MSTVGQREIKTQKRVIKYFVESLGYRYLGHWKDRPNNSNIETEYLENWLKQQGHSNKIISKIRFKLEKASALGGSKTLYDVNKEFYGLLRYGVEVKPSIGEHHFTAWLIDWENPENNDFAIAEEVSISGEHGKRPDIVFYINGIAVGVLELKRSTISVAEGIRQNLDSQKKEFIRPFYTTVQLVMAGNDTQGLRYGVIETAEKYYLEWKEQSKDWTPQLLGDTKYLSPWDDTNIPKLDYQLGWICRKDRILEIIHDFMVFDAGIKKTCRHNQYFGVQAAKENAKNREGGIIWHTQGSGKSLTMVWLAKWIREHTQESRVLIITDRTELDEQIEKVFKGVSEDIYRTKSGADLVSVLNETTQWLMCSLIHKFGSQDDVSDKDIETYVEDIRNNLPKGFVAKGNIFIFVDEAHRTQSGKLHEAVKVLLPDSTFIGFTGTPLLKKDKQKSIEVFGPYIHTYKYDEAVRDGVVLDLRYEARDIDQNITSQEKVDQWFEVKTRGLSDLAKADLKKRWGTMQKVLSSRDRLEKIVADILLDMESRDRLMNGHGNALLVSSSIYSACRFFEMFQRTNLSGKCAIITSYKPNPGDIKGEETGEGLTEKLRQYEIYRKMLAAHFNEDEEKAMYKVDKFEQQVKRRFIDEPGQMKLLIVVDKLLTGFNAPPATYLYIDKQMRDHGLFQAICRVNRLDGDDKEYGYIVDYKDLFKSLEKSIKDYTGEAFEGYDAEDVAFLLKDRLKKGRERLDELRESVKALCEPVEPPKDMSAYIRFFCSIESGNSEQLNENEQKRIILYRLVASLVRAYANLANEMLEAGYSRKETDDIKAEVSHYEKVREEIKLVSADYVDMKLYEPAMRHLLDTYIRAEESEVVSAFDDMTLVELIVERGEEAVESLPKSISGNEKIAAETIENNVRKLIIDESPVNPKYYEKMSELLDALILQRRKQALDYKAYLKKIVELTKEASQPESKGAYPSNLNTPARRAFHDNLGQNANLAIAVDNAILSIKKDGWREMRAKKMEVYNAIKSILGDDDELVDIIFSIAEEPKNGY